MMKRIFSFLFIISNLLFAEVTFMTERFIGIEIGRTNVQGSTPNDESMNASYGLRLGSQNSEWRTIIGFNYFDSGEHNIEKLFLTIDYFFLGEELTKSKIAPYMGINTGYMSFEKVGVNTTGALYGVNGGVVYKINKKIDIDLGMRYSLSNSASLDHSNDILFSIQYKY